MSLVLGWVVTRNATAVAQGGTDVQSVSYVIERWVGADVALDPFEEQLFGSGRVVKRGYVSQPLPTANGEVSSGELPTPIGLLAVQTFGDRHAHHPPEYCYTGSGWEVRELPPANWELAPGNRPVSIVVERVGTNGKRERELVFYWFTDGDRHATSYFERTVYDAWDRLRGAPKSWLLVRISRPLGESESLSVAETVLKTFSLRVHNNVSTLMHNS